MVRLIEAGGPRLAKLAAAMASQGVDVRVDPPSECLPA